MKNESHTQYDIQYHIVWTTKYRYKILDKKVAIRLRELMRQGCEAKGITIVNIRRFCLNTCDNHNCEAKGITIVKGSIGKEHVHILISSPPSISVSEIVKYLKGRSSRFLQEEFKEL